METFVQQYSCQKKTFVHVFLPNRSLVISFKFCYELTQPFLNIENKKSIKMRLSRAKYSLDKSLPRTKIFSKLFPWSHVFLDNWFFEQLSIGQLLPGTAVSFETCPLNNCFTIFSHQQFHSSMLLFSSCQKISMLFLNPTRVARSNLSRSDKYF